MSSGTIAAALSPGAGAAGAGAGAASVGGSIASNANWLSLATAGVSGISSVVGGIQKSNADLENAKEAEYQASVTTQESQAEATQVQQQTRLNVGNAMANAGASGVDPNQGSPANAIAAIAGQGELSRQLVLYRGTLQSNAQLYGASLDKYNAGQATGAGIATGGTTFLTSAAKYLQNNPNTALTATY